MDLLKFFHGHISYTKNILLMQVLLSINSVNKLNELIRIILLSYMNYIGINITKLNMTTKMIQ